jgi:hypothetical protein
MNAPRGPTELRHALQHAGYSPIPVQGKIPALKAWQDKVDSNSEEIALWEKLIPQAVSTGFLTRATPTIDIDILNPEAAEAIEVLAKERFEERGHVLVRIGQAPKRAIPLRTDAPFRKIVGNVVAPDGSEQKIELLGDGQQVVVFGLHPATGKPYSWHGGEPGAVRWEDLPYVTAAEAQAFVDEAVGLLVTEYAYKMPAARPKERAKGNGHDDTPGGGADWAWLIGSIQGGRELHDSTCALAAKLVATGMNDAAAVNVIRGVMESAASPRDDRWKERYADVPRAVKTAREKYGETPGEPTADADFLAFWHGEVELATSRSWMVQDTIPEVGAGLLSGQWGTYKTFTAIDLGCAVMSGTSIFGSDVVRRGGVLLYAAEGESEVPIRLQASIDKRCPDLSKKAPFTWLTPDKVALNLLDPKSVVDFVAHAQRIGAEIQKRFGLPLALVLVDTVVATAGYTKSGDENDTVLGVRLMKNGLREIAQKTGTFVLGIDHFGKSAETGTRGTSAKEDNSDVILATLGTKSITGVVTSPRLAVRKVRGGVAGREYAFSTRVVDTGLADTNLRPIKTLVLDWTKIPISQNAVRDKRDPWSKSLRLLRRVLMNVLADMGTERRPHADGPIVRAVDAEIVRAEFYKNYVADGDTKEQKQDAKRQAFNRALKTAQAGGLIGVREIGEIQYVWLARPAEVGAA